MTDSQMFIDISGDPTPGIPDGLKVDVSGHVWESAAGGVWIISPEGRHLGTILTPELVANVEFGDPDRKTLYIAARTSVRSEEHTSELQSRLHLVCRLLLEKKKLDAVRTWIAASVCLVIC